MMIHKRSSVIFPTKREDGMALVITLALIVLVTVAAVAFLSRATGNRAVEASRSNQILSAQLAETGGDYVEGIFLQMITNSGMINFTSVSGGSVTNYTPTNLPGMTWMAPTPLLTSTISLTDTNFYNLIRQSIPDTNTPSIETNASASDNTANPSLNGRVVTLDHWNAPMLLPNGFASTNQLPNWIYVNRDGSMTPTPSTNVIGRFAYNAYDIGGLLDANAAGCPSTIASGATNLAVLKGTLAGADLTQLGVATSDAEALVIWRNAGSITKSTPVDYLSAIATNAFISPAPGDQSFTSRQDLIRYVLMQSNSLTNSLTNALPFLTHFTRELARPSLYTNGLNLMTNRFDLSKLSRGTSPPLTPSPVLTGATTGDFFSIICSALNFSTIAAENATPIGLFTTQTPDPAWAGDMNLKAVAIGANIIDQFNTNSPDPTDINYTNATSIIETVAGKKPLPYISQVFMVYNMTTNTIVRAGVTNTISTLYFSVIPQVAMATNATNPPDFYTDLLGGTLTLRSPGAGATATTIPPSSGRFTNPSIPTGTNPFLNPLSPGSATNIVEDGFYYTTLTVTNDAGVYPTSFLVSLNNLSFSFGKNSNVYSAFGIAQTNTNFISANLTVPLTPITLLPGDISPARSTLTSLAAIAIQSVDPRTLRDAGNTNAIPAGPTNTVLATAITLTNPYSGLSGTTITDTNSQPTPARINSVGELGYVYREIPGRTIDFVSGTTNTSPSSDWKLLDVFSAFPTPPNGLRAGVLNLNTRQSNVIAAVLSGASINAEGTGTLAASDVATFASQMVANTSTTNALTNRSQLVDLVNNNIIASSSVSDKQARETAIRALAEVGQTRTWNLLIDVVAQAGRFSPNAMGAGSSPTGSQFIVGGVNRIWLSTAIDRFTGQVIDRQVEQVK